LPGHAVPYPPDARVEPLLSRPQQHWIPATRPLSRRPPYIGGLPGERSR